jgi:hypothetical protein
MVCDNRTAESGVSYAVNAEAIEREPTKEVPIQNMQK